MRPHRERGCKAPRLLGENDTYDTYILAKYTPHLSCMAMQRLIDLGIRKPLMYVTASTWTRDDRHASTTQTILTPNIR